MEGMCASCMYAAGFRTFFVLSSLCHLFFFFSYPVFFFLWLDIEQTLMQGVCSSRTRLNLEYFCCVFLLCVCFFFFFNRRRPFVTVDTRMPGTYLGTALSFWGFVDEER
jgi:hypothetical protein